MPKLIAILLSSAMIALLATSGCGDSSSGTTKAEFVKEADAACLKGNKEKTAALEAYLLKLGVGPEKLMTPKQSAFQWTGVILPPIQKMTKQVDELQPPEGEEQKIASIVRAAERGISVATKEAKDLEKKGSPGKFNDPFERVAGLSSDYGFKVCYINY